MPAIRQTSFLGGELSPELWGRTDLGLYAKGLRRCLNFFVSPRGPLVSRPGTLFQGFAKGGQVGAASYTGARVRLGPYAQPDGHYLLEWGPLYVRLWKAGAVVATLDTEYTQDELASLQWAQFGDVLVVTQANRRPYALKPTTVGAAWSFALLDMTPEALGPTSFYDLVVGQSGRLPPVLLDSPVDSLFVGDSTHFAKEWRYKVSATYLTSAGAEVESEAYPVTQWSNGVDAAEDLPESGRIILYPDKPVTLILMPNPAGMSPTLYPVKQWNVYRGRGDVFGYVGSFASDSFVDDGAEPDYSLQPLRGTDPRIGLQSGADVLDVPRCLAHHEGRRWLAGWKYGPTRARASAAGNFLDWDSHFKQVAGEALDFELASTRRESILSLLSARRLLAFTDVGAWAIGGAGGAPLDFDSLEARLVDSVGIGDAMPVDAGGIIYWARSRGRGIRALVPTQNYESGYAPTDATWHAQHLFNGYQATASPYTAAVENSVRELVWAEEPWRLLWAVRDDGILLSGTPSGESVAWARHEFAGAVESVAVVRGDREDEVYLAVRRAWGVCIEKLASRVRNGDFRDGCAVDCGIVAGTAADSKQIFGLSHLEGQSVYFVAQGNPVWGPLVVSGGQVVLPEVPISNNDSIVPCIGYVGLGFTCDVELLDVVSPDSRNKQKTTVSVGFEVDESRGLFVGQDEDKLVEWRQRSVADSYGPPSAATEVVVMPVRGRYDLGARAFLRQTAPLNVTVLGITREVDVGG